MTINAENRAALVVASDRDDRRLLFDALDAQGFDAIYSARDLVQARNFLKQDAQVELVLLEFNGEAIDALAFCGELSQYRPGAPVAVIGLLSRAAGPVRWRRGGEPPGVVEWITLPAEIDDARRRIRGVMSGLGQRPASGTAGATASVDRYQFAFDGSLDEIAVVDPVTGRILDVNTTFLQRSGYPRTQLLSSSIEGFDFALSPERRTELNVTLAREGVATLRGRKPRADGTTYAVDLYARLAVQEGRLVHFYLFRELGELGRYQGALRALGGLADAVDFDTAAQAVVDWLELDFLAIVEALPEHVGEILPLAVYHRFGVPDHVPDPLQQVSIRRVLAGREVLLTSEAWREAGNDAFVRGRHFECLVGLPLIGERRTVLGALLLARREPLEAGEAAIETLRICARGLAVQLELRRAREQGRVTGLMDPLTALPNRLLFNDRLGSAIHEAHRSSEMFAVVFVDLDRFKTINDSLGHQVGDQVLVAVAKRLRASVRASDTVARYAGDEFTLILRHIIQREDVERIAEKIVRAMEAPLTLEGGLELNITASLGISFYPDDATDAERLLKYADVAMYSVKGMGRNSFQAYVAVPEDSHQQRLALEAKLRMAEKNGELRVFYQPQVDCRTEDIVGMEALLRWEHPELGMISPGFFVPLAEESGLIVSIGEWVLRAACRDARRWQVRYGLPLRIGVNLSPLQLRQPNLVALVESVLEETGLDPRLLDLEVTESISVKTIPRLLETLNGLRDLGCSISIDDFGTGQASLDYLRRFPADHIKIDQGFVRNIGVDPDDEAIVQATIVMAHNLNREVVAEGVEIERHLEFLREHGCEIVQGFLFCRPLPAASFDNLLQERERMLGGHAPTPLVSG